MRLTISEIKEKAEVGDKFDFPAIVEKVYQMQKKNLQYAVGIQNVIVKDDSDKITVGMFIKNEEDAFDKNLEGKKVQVSGEYSTFQKNGKLYKNISKGKILIQEDTQKSDNSKSNITPEQIRIECLKITLQHVDMLEEKTADTRDIINNAKLFEKYVTGNKIEGAVNTPEKAVEKAMEKAELKEKKEDPDLDLKVKTINYIMELTKENQSMNLVDDFVSKCGQENIKELTLKQLETLVSKLKYR
jgi:hypothetical protein